MSYPPRPPGMNLPPGPMPVPYMTGEMTTDGSSLVIVFYYFILFYHRAHDAGWYAANGNNLHVTLIISKT